MVFNKNILSMPWEKDKEVLGKMGNNTIASVQKEIVEIYAIHNER